MHATALAGSSSLEPNASEPKSESETGVVMGEYVEASWADDGERTATATATDEDEAGGAQQSRHTYACPSGHGSASTVTA